MNNSVILFPFHVIDTFYKTMIYIRITLSDLLEKLFDTVCNKFFMNVCYTKGFFLHALFSWVVQI